MRKTGPEIQSLPQATEMESDRSTTRCRKSLLKHLILQWQERETLGKREERECERKRDLEKGRGKAEKEEAGSGRAWQLEGCPKASE